jgi:hypothetical protein
MVSRSKPRQLPPPSFGNSIVGGAVYLMHSAGSTFVERGLRLFGGRCEVIFALWDVLDCKLLRVENG